MIKQFILLLSIIILGTLSAQGQHRYKDITGIWESTSYMSDDDEPSIDTFIILNHEGKYGIVCVSYEHFSVSEIHRDNNYLKFVMLNSLSRPDMYILEYDCYIVEEDRIECRFTNQLGEKVDDIVWRRIN